VDILFYNVDPDFWNGSLFHSKSGDRGLTRACKAGTLRPRRVFRHAHVRAGKQIAFHFAVASENLWESFVIIFF
jgi:hypothetical protein